MYSFIGMIIVIVFFLTIGAIYTAFKPRITFYISGLDAGFSINDIQTLWKASSLSGLEDPNTLFYSMNSLTRCMERISNSTLVVSPQERPRYQALLAKLFDYRTKIQNESDSKKGLQSTLSLDNGQKLRIILPGRGVFTSEILNNGKQIVITLPKKKDIIEVPANEWVNKSLSVYLWRKGDARYVFDTTVTQSGLFLGQPALFINHSNNLVRTQKRKAVRAKCSIYAQLYIVKEKVSDYNAVETRDGYKCLIEDISESGALIRVGGKGLSYVQIKLQFNIQSLLIVMFGTIKHSQFNEEKNESLLHFECTHIESAMKNEVLSFVYNMLPEPEKEVMQALDLTDEDVAADITAPKNPDGEPGAEGAATGALAGAGGTEAVTAANFSAAGGASEITDVDSIEEAEEVFPEPVINI